MNRNIPHAVKVVRAAMASSGSDPATAIAHALDNASLLVDPEKSFGIVLRRRTLADDSAHGHPEQQKPQEPPQLTELEEQALAWDASCKRASQVAAAIKGRIGAHPAFQSIQVDGDRILVALQVLNQAQWAEWQKYFGIREETTLPPAGSSTQFPYAVTGAGSRDGVRVSVVAYDLPGARAHARKVAKQPFEVDGIVYDLARPQRDAGGDVWFYQGVRTPQGMPLLSVDGRPERCSLANIARLAGPLTAVTDAPSPQVAPVTTGVEGGGQA